MQQERKWMQSLLLTEDSTSVSDWISKHKLKHLGLPRMAVGGPVFVQGKFFLPQMGLFILMCSQGLLLPAAASSTPSFLGTTGGNQSLTIFHSSLFIALVHTRHPPLTLPDTHILLSLPDTHRSAF
jgi:hypothetical protein